MEKASLNFSMSGMSLDDFVSNNGEASLEQVVNSGEIAEIEISELKDFDEHYFKIYTDEKLREMSESIKKQGIIQPLIVRKKNNEYVILSGHNRVRAAKLAGLTKAKAIVLEGLSDKEAKLIVTETNLFQRSFADMLVSERAKSLRQRYEALEMQGNGELDDEKQDIDFLKKMEKTGEGLKVSATTAFRYVKLADLTDSLLEQVDAGILTFLAGYEISFIDKESQEMLERALALYKKKLGVEAARKLRELNDSKNLTPESMHEVLFSKPDKKLKKKTYSIGASIIEKYNLSHLSDKEFIRLIDNALAAYTAEK